MKSKIKLTDRYIKQIGLDLTDNVNQYIIRKGYQTEVDTEEDGYVIGTITTDDVDSDGDVILPNGIDFSRYLKNPIVLKNHSLESPIGFTDNIEVSNNHVVSKIKFGKTEEAQNVYQLMKDKVLRTFSIGFITVEAKKRGEIGFQTILSDLQNKYPERFNKTTIPKIDRIITKSLLIETSVVSVPANEYATTILVKNFSENEEENKIDIKTPENKGVIIKKIESSGIQIKKISTIEDEQSKILIDIYKKMWGI